MIAASRLYGAKHLLIGKKRQSDHRTCQNNSASQINIFLFHKCTHCSIYTKQTRWGQKKKKKQYIFSLICYLYKFWKRILLNWKNKHIKKEKMTMEKTNEVAVLHGILIQISKEKGITRCVCNYSVSSWQMYGKKLIYCKYEKLHSSEKYVFCTFNRNSKQYFAGQCTTKLKKKKKNRVESWNM